MTIAAPTLASITFDCIDALVVHAELDVDDLSADVEHLVDLGTTRRGEYREQG